MALLPLHPTGWALSCISILAVLAFSDAFPYSTTFHIHSSNFCGAARKNIDAIFVLPWNNEIALRNRPIKPFASSDTVVPAADVPNPIENLGEIKLKPPSPRVIIAPKFTKSNHLASTASESLTNSIISTIANCSKIDFTSRMRNIWRKILECTYFVKSRLHNKLQPLVRKIFLALSLLLLSITTAPSMAHASSTASSPDNYSVSSRKGVPSSTSPKRKLISVHAQSPQSHSGHHDEFSPTKRQTTVIRRNYPKSKRHIKASKRLATFFVGGSIIASSFRSPDGDNSSNIISIGKSRAMPSRRRNRRIRNTTPFGIIRNLSPLGNGVSVIRVRLALEFAYDTGNGNTEEGLGANGFLAELNDEKQLLQTDIMTMLPNMPSEIQGRFRRKVMGNHLSNVATLLRQYQPFIKYGSIDSMRVPFAEEALREFKQIKNEERDSYVSMKETFSEGDEREPTQQQKSVMITEEGKTFAKSNTDGYIMVTILLAIKGDHTTIPLPLGLSQRREMGRALIRIAEDSTVEDCLVGSEIFCLPNKIYIDDGKIMEQGDEILLTEAEVLYVFPDLSRLS